MTQNQKILIGVGLLGLGYLLWKSSKKPATTTTGEGTGEGVPSIGGLPDTIKNGAVINGKKYSISSQADCPDGYTFGNPPPPPCLPGRICDSGGPRCYRMSRGPICSAGLMPCPDDAGCFDPSKNPISDWESGLPHPCNRALTIGLNLKDTRPV